MQTGVGIIGGLLWLAAAIFIWWLCASHLLPEEWYKGVRKQNGLWTWRMVSWLCALIGFVLTFFINIFTWYSYLLYSGREAEFSIPPPGGWMLTGLVFWIIGFLLPILGKEFSARLDWQDQRRNKN